MSIPDTLLNTAITYGPGLTLAAAAYTIRHSCHWAADRRRDRAETRRYQATATRLHTVADRTDQIIADAGNQLAKQLRHHIDGHTQQGEQ